MVSDEVVAGFNARASSYDASEMHRWLAGVVADGLPSEVGDVLDVATGTALALRAMSAHASSVTGLDAARDLLDVAKSALPEGRFVEGRAEELPFRSESFDTVLCVSALPYLDVPAAAREWARVCRPRGRVVVTAIRSDGITSSRLFRRAAAESGIVLIDPNAMTGTEDALSSLGRSVGLELEEVTDAAFEAATPDAGESFDIQLRYGFGVDVIRSGRRDAIGRRFRELMSVIPVERYEIMIARFRPAMAAE